MMARLAWIWLVLALTTAALACDRAADTSAAVHPAPTIDRAALDVPIDGAVEAAEPGTTLSVWLGPPVGAAWYARDADVSRPAASAIKTAYLIELFDAYADRLDAPLAGIDDALQPAHPAVVHFDEAQQEEIRRDLTSASVREIGHHMIRGTGVSNVVYNAAANVTTAVLGGPAELTRRIHARDAAFAGLVSRRYMLAARDVTGDNEATASSLAAVLQRIAAGQVAGVAPATLEAMREILAVEDQTGPDRHFFKSGWLDSDPLTRIHSGFWNTTSGTFVYVVMAERPDPGALARDEAGRRLQSTVERVSEAVEGAARAALGSGS